MSVCFWLLKLGNQFGLAVWISFPWLGIDEWLDMSVSVQDGWRNLGLVWTSQPQYFGRTSRRDEAVVHQQNPSSDLRSFECSNFSASANWRKIEKRSGSSQSWRCERASVSGWEWGGKKQSNEAAAWLGQGGGSSTSSSWLVLVLVLISLEEQLSPPVSYLQLSSRIPF